MILLITLFGNLAIIYIINLVSHEMNGTLKKNIYINWPSCVLIYCMFILTDFILIFVFIFSVSSIGGKTYDYDCDNSEKYILYLLYKLFVTDKLRTDPTILNESGNYSSILYTFKRKYFTLLFLKCILVCMPHFLFQLIICCKFLVILRLPLWNNELFVIHAILIT